MDAEFLRYKFEEDHDGGPTVKSHKIGVRHLQMLYMFVCSAAFGVIRSSNTVAVLAMADLSRQNQTYTQVHNWDRRIQGTILSSFFFGYALAFLPAELYLRRVRGKLVVAGALLVNGALAAAMPIIANKGGWIAMCNALFLMGMTQASLYPANVSLLSKWMPSLERGLFGSFVQSGALVGTIVSFPLSGMVSETRLSWKLIFYSQSMVTFSLAAVWIFLTASTPDDHQAVGDAEKEYIESAVVHSQKRVVDESSIIKPWRRFARSPSLWAVACAHAASGAIFTFYMAELPGYLLTYGLTLKNSSLIAMLPFILMLMVNLMTAPAVEWMRDTECYSYILSLTNFRKFINTIGAFGITVALVIITNLNPSSGRLVIMLAVIVLGLSGFQFSGFLGSLRDLSDEHCTTLLMMTSVISNLAGAVVPLLTGFVLGGDLTNHVGWKTMFKGLTTFYVFCNIIYGTVFGVGSKYGQEYVRVKKKGYRRDFTQVELDDM